MKRSFTDTTQAEGSSGIFGAIAAAVVASLCCVGPLVLVSLGIGGAWVGSLTALEPYRPLLMAVTMIFLGFAFYQVYRGPKTEACEPGAYCANPKAKTINKVVLWAVTVLVAGLLVFPYVAPRLYATTGAGTNATNGEKVSLAVENMTCAMCPITVKKALAEVPGVLDADVTLDPPEAIVTYDPDRVSVEDLTAATEQAGYPSSVKQDGGG